MGNTCSKKKSALPVTSVNDGKSFRANMVQEKQLLDVFHVYNVVKVLGEGTMGAVSCVRKKASAVGGSAYPRKNEESAPSHVLEQSNDKVYALKGIKLSMISELRIEELKNEINVLRSLDHPNIIKAYEVYYGVRNIHLVMENCAGGDLFSRNPYTEQDANKITRQILSALSYLHQNNVVHRDLKFENIMFESADRNSPIKLIDFGLAKKFLTRHRTMEGCVGTLYSMAPQVMKGKYTKQADMWSVGVITYMLLSDSRPFWQQDQKQLIEANKNCRWRFYRKIWNDLSDESKDFISSLIKFNPDERLTATTSKEHKWFRRGLYLSTRKMEASNKVDAQNRIGNYGQVSEFQKMALMIIAHKATSDEIIELRKAFHEFDQNNSGTIDLFEFKSSMQKFDSSYSDEKLEEMFDHVDQAKDGVIRYTEFLAATMNVHGRVVEDRLAEAFDRIDSDDTGFISRENLVNILGTDCSMEKVDHMIASVEANDEGDISFQSFLKAFQRETSKNEKMLSKEDDDDKESD